MDFGDVGESATEARLKTPKTPTPVVKINFGGGKQLLQGPSTSEPPTIFEVGFGENRGNAYIRLEVLQIGNTARGSSIPVKHGVDGLAQFGAAGLVDAARVDPDMVRPF